MARFFSTVVMCFGQLLLVSGRMMVNGHGRLEASIAAAVEDAEHYDGGVMLARVNALSAELIEVSS